MADGLSSNFDLLGKFLQKNSPIYADEFCNFPPAYLSPVS